MNLAGRTAALREVRKYLVDEVLAAGYNDATAQANATEEITRFALARNPSLLRWLLSEMLAGR